MKSVLIAAIVILILVGLSALGALITNKQATIEIATETPVIEEPEEPLYVEAEPTKLIGEWKGHLSEETKTFPVTGKWKVDWGYWKYTCGAFGTFSIEIYNENDIFIDTIADVAHQSAKDTSYQHDSGKYYLKINSSDDGYWQVRVYGN